MTWLLWFLFGFFIGLPLALFIGYAIGIQYERQTWPAWVPALRGKTFPEWLRYLCAVVVFLALIVDVIANWSVFWICFWQKPRRGEFTFSDRLERWVTEPGWRASLAWPIARLLNWLAPPGHPHIHNAVSVTGKTAQ